MQLFHATPAVNVPSIRRAGLLTAMAQGAQPRIWLTTWSRRLWAAWHASSRHAVLVRDVVTLEWDVPSEWVRRSRFGVWTCRRDIPADRLVAISVRAGCVPWPFPQSETPW